MRGREGKEPPSTDLLVCFPSRAHLALMPKQISSPTRASESYKRHSYHHHPHSDNQHRLKKSINRSGIAGQASPLLWVKTKQMSPEIAEPTSPKVTCAGQIKVKHKPNSCKNWQTVMEEIERIHNNKQKKRHNWVESLGFKKEIVQFLTCLRNVKLDFRCFGSFPTSDIASDDEDDNDNEEDDDHGDGDSIEASGSSVFSKWIMVLQENQNKDLMENQFENRDGSYSFGLNENDSDDHVPCAPPSNALLLMRCRSAPAKSLLEEMEEQEEENDEEDKRAQLAMEEEKKKNNKKESIVAMRCDIDFAKLSIDIAKETWIVGGIKDQLSRSRSSKR